MHIKVPLRSENMRIDFGGSKARKPVIYQWAASSYYGWGIYGLNLALNWALHPYIEVYNTVPFDPTQYVVNQLEDSILQPVVERSARLAELINSCSDPIVEASALVLTPLFNNIITAPENKPLIGMPNIGIIFSENSYFDKGAQERAAYYPLIIAGSNWNRDILSASDIDNVTVVLQGVDTTTFHPAPKYGFFCDRFVVFCGGKLEYRKGQDLVVQAFRIFAERHPDALLLTAWNSGFKMADSLSANRAVRPVQATAEGDPDIFRWTAENGIPGRQAMQIGQVPQMHMARILREADVALFPNRAEGGTNLVAMECMACGVPCILSANTGHLDLIRDGNCYPIQNQKKIDGAAHLGWGESDIDEILANLEMAYANRSDAAQRGRLGASFMANLSWKAQLNRLAAALRPYLT
jgi:glycosyltransferase involved in cell wall biosynthesis